MKVARFDGNRTGLIVETDAGTGVVDVAASIGTLGASGAIVAETIGPDGAGPWVPLIQAWGDARVPLEELARLGASRADGVEVVNLDVFDRGVLNWAFQKNFETGNAFGPWVCVDEGPDPYHVHLTTRVNGEVRQDATTDDAIFDYGANAEYISRFVALKTGDIITSGTIHGTAIEGGVNGPFLQPGDVVEVEVRDVGILRNYVGEWDR
jgi:hypothetical protein